MSKGDLVINDSKLEVVPAVSSYMGFIEAAINKGADIVTLERLMDLQERHEATIAKREFNIAMSQFQSELPVIEKLGVVDYQPQGKARTYYTYAKLEDIAHKIKAPLKSAGLAYRFTQEQSQNGVITVTCIVTHSGGHSETSSLSSSPDSSGGKDGIKAIASAVQYLRRYTVTGLLGIVVGGEDNETPQEQYQECLPDADFRKHFPAWSEILKSKKKTVEELHQFLTEKNIILSQQQFDELQQAGNTND